MLNVGDRARIDFDLKMGAATETITVEADAVRVQTDSGEVSSVITGQQVTQLATNGRSMYSLANLTPGASSGQADFQIPTPVGGDAAMSFNGQRMSHNLYMLDGSESSDRGGGGGSDVMPSLDAIGEFRMLTSNYSAEYGLSSAATMTAVIRSGSKQFHASAWEFLRNDALDARNYFNRKPDPVAELRFNTYGFNVGGQVPLWKSHPTFFFYNMEWRSLIQGQVLNQTVPLPSTYGGNFGSTTDHGSNRRLSRHPGAIRGRWAHARTTLPQQHHSSQPAGSQRAGPAGGGHFPQAHQRRPIHRWQQRAHERAGRGCQSRPSVHRQVLDFRTLGF